MSNTPDLEKVRDHVVNRLAHELSPLLTYHGLKHTLEEVVPAIDTLAPLEKISNEDHLLVLTAAYFHDLGFIRIRDGHEAISIQFAKQALPAFGYSDRQITVISGIIRATHLPQSPTNLLERIMADADLDYLGHEDFWKRSDDFRRELENYGTRFTEEEWYIYQVNFMENHSYFTASARQLREPIKQAHIVELKQLLERVKRLKYV